MLPFLFNMREIARHYLLFIHCHLLIVSYGCLGWGTCSSAACDMTLCFISLTAQTHLPCRSEPNSFVGVGWGAMDFFPLSPNDSTVRCCEG